MSNRRYQHEVILARKKLPMGTKSLLKNIATILRFMNWFQQLHRTRQLYVPHPESMISLKTPLVVIRKYSLIEVRPMRVRQLRRTHGVRKDQESSWLLPERVSISKPTLWYANISQ